MNRIVFDPVIPLPWIVLIGVALAAATVSVYFQVGIRLSRWRNAVLAFCRLSALALVLAALLQPSRRDEIPVTRGRSVLLVGIDASRSMRQTDAGNDVTRLQAAKNIVRNAGLLSPGNDNAEVQFFGFGDNAAAVPAGAVEALKADATTTNFHRSVQTMLDAVPNGETIKGVVLLSDGHDLELTSPAITAFEARTRWTSIYAVPLGAQGNVRDASLHITNFQPYCFVGQQAHISASIRLIGCEHEDVTVQLIRQDEVIKTVQLNAGEQSELPVDFAVSEKEPGQYQYEVRVVPLAHEADVTNNGALTYLNVVNQQIAVLLLEGAPYWDTTFLSRSLFGNDKIALDAIFEYMPDKLRRIRKVPAAGDLNIPATRQDFDHYDAVILGQDVDRMLDPTQIAALGAYVREHGGTVIFARGKAYERADELDPVTWADSADGNVSLVVGQQSGSLPVLRALAQSIPGGLESMPRLLGARRIAGRKTLDAIVAEARDAGDAAAFPAIVYRHYGRGQVLSVAVDGLWRWGLNSKTTAANNLFDRIWDRLLVWLVAGSDFTPSQQYSFRANTANLPMGEKISLHLASRDIGRPLEELPVTLSYNGQPIARTSLAPAPNDPTALHADYLPDKPGLYRAAVTLPDGATQEVKWMVYEDNPEEKEVAADVPYLRTLCENSGGRLLAPEELKSTVERLTRPAAALQPKTKLTSLWDRVWVFYLIGLALGLDWYLRRKWGLS
jgi:uncharacterized membrane protein